MDKNLTYQECYGYWLADENYINYLNGKQKTKMDDIVNKVIYGLALPETKKLPAESIDCVITSPPYWQLRNYGFSEQWGLEPTFEQYLEHLWQMMDELYRVLKPTGTVWVNLGDTYGTVSGAMRDGKFGSKNTNNQPFIQPKSLHKCQLLIPHRFAIGCVERGWIVRNDIIWAKRNCMPESVKDRFSKKHEFVFLLVKSPKYYFDLDSVRDKSVYDNSRAKILGRGNQGYAMASGSQRDHSGGYGDCNGLKNPGNVSDFWDIPTRSSKVKHYATFNSDLINKPIIAGCPGGGIVLDPFCGVGTTLIRARELNRNVIGIEGSKKYHKIAEKNLKEFQSQLNMFMK